MDLKRFLYHLFVGVVIAGLWLYSAWPGGLCSGPGNTELYWFGLYLLLLQLMVRAARFVQKNRGGNPPLEEQLVTWLRLAGPYFVETVPYLGAAVSLMILGGSDTLTVYHTELRPGSDLALLGLLSLVLCPVCATVLGWKLAGSNLPAQIPILAAGFLCLVAVPGSFAFNETWIPNSFPLIQLCILVTGSFVFLFVCLRSRSDWMAGRQTPHPALLAATVMPGALPLMMALILLSEGLAPALVGTGLTALGTALAAGPLCLGLWLPRRLPREGFPLALSCFALGVASFYHLVLVGSVVFMMEDARLSLSWNPWYLLGGMSVVAPALFRVKPTVD